MNSSPTKKQTKKLKNSSSSWIFIPQISKSISKNVKDTNFIIWVTSFKILNDMSAVHTQTP